MTEGVGVHVIVDVFVKPFRTLASTPLGMAVIAGAAMAVFLILHAIADTIIFGLEILGLITLAAIVLTATYLLGKRRATRSVGLWQPADTGWAISTDPALIAGLGCWRCRPLWVPAAAILRDPKDMTMPLCADCRRPGTLHAITRGRP